MMVCDGDVDVCDDVVMVEVCVVEYDVVGKCVLLLLMVMCGDVNVVLVSLDDEEVVVV